MEGQHYRHVCKKCGKLLCKGELSAGTVEIKCRRCKTVNSFTGGAEEQAPQPPREDLEDGDAEDQG